jgi:hypothetical protein
MIKMCSRRVSFKNIILLVYDFLLHKLSFKLKYFNLIITYDSCVILCDFKALGFLIE